MLAMCQKHHIYLIRVWRFGMGNTEEVVIYRVPFQGHFNECTCLQFFWWNPCDSFFPTVSSYFSRMYSFNRLLRTKKNSNCVQRNTHTHTHAFIFINYTHVNSTKLLSSISYIYIFVCCSLYNIYAALRCVHARGFIFKSLCRRETIWQHSLFIFII